MSQVAEDPMRPRLPFPSAATTMSETPAVHPLFDLSTPAGSPFPSDRFTVVDPDRNNGRRVTHRPDCNDLGGLNELDGFHTAARHLASLLQVVEVEKRCDVGAVSKAELLQTRA